MPGVYSFVKYFVKYIADYACTLYIRGSQPFET